MSTLLQDLRYAARMLRKSPGFTAVAILTLALGIGANAAIFSLANAAFFRALPYPHAERLAFLWQNNQRTGESEGAVSYPNYADWRAQSHGFRDMAIMSSGQVLLFAKGHGIERVAVAQVSTNLFDVLAVSPILGRNFTAADGLPGPVRSVIISYGLWQRQYGGDPKIIGHPAGFGDAASNIIVGVMPPYFPSPDGTEMWEAVQLIDYLKTKSRQYPIFHVIGRLRPGLELSSAQAEMNTIAQRLATQYPAINGGMGIRIVPLREQLSQNVRAGLLVLWCAVLGVLLIACVNAANLMMARAAGRQTEIAVRFSLGATRVRIVRQFLAESLLLTAVGAVTGLFLAYWIVALVSKFNPDIARLGGGTLDARVLLYTIAVAAFTAVICAMLPAFSASHLDLNRTLKETSGTASPGMQLIRKLLIIAEVSLAFILLAGSGLLIRSLWQIFSVNPGFDAGHVLALDVDFPWTSPNLTNNKRNSLYQELVARLHALPGVVNVASASEILLPPAKDGVSFVTEGQPSASPGQRPVFPNVQVTPNYFQTMGIPLLRGRWFNDADTAEHAQFVAIIDETMARRCWPNGDAIGKRFRKYDPSRETPWWTVVGVVGDVRLGGLEDSAHMVAYEPSSGAWSNDYLMIHTAGDPLALIPAVRDIVRDVDKNLAILSIMPVSSMLSLHESQREFNASLLGAFAFVALLLAAVGIYGSISYWVKQRTQEIGVRMALGAQPRNILTLVIGRGMAVIFVGLALGIAGALALTRLISTMLFGIRPEDPLTYVLVAFLLAAVALAACYIPARRAMKVDPIVALRYE